MDQKLIDLDSCNLPKKTAILTADGADHLCQLPRFESLCRILSEELLVKKQAILDEFKTSSPEVPDAGLLLCSKSMSAIKK